MHKIIYIIYVGRKQVFIWLLIFCTMPGECSADFSADLITQN